MPIVEGACHCGNISFVAEMPNILNTYQPRACNCQLCKAHGAAYVSDRQGKLQINIKDQAAVSRYRQGSQIADFLICKNCGVLTNVCYEEGGNIYASINASATRCSDDFAANQVIKLTQLTDEERIRRWKQVWFSNIRVEYGI